MHDCENLYHLCDKQLLVCVCVLSPWREKVSSWYVLTNNF